MAAPRVSPVERWRVELAQDPRIASVVHCASCTVEELAEAGVSIDVAASGPRDALHVAIERLGGRGGARSLRVHDCVSLRDHERHRLAEQRTDEFFRALHAVRAIRDLLDKPRWSLCDDLEAIAEILAGHGFPVPRTEAPATFRQTAASCPPYSREEGHS